MQKLSKAFHLCIVKPSRIYSVLYSYTCAIIIVSYAPLEEMWISSINGD